MYSFPRQGASWPLPWGVPVEEEDEDIPQELRPMVKMIRELKKKIEEKLRELQEAMRSSDPGGEGGSRA